MDQQIAQNAITFMNRVELRGQEVNAWAQVMAALQEIVTEQNKDKKETAKTIADKVK